MKFDARVNDCFFLSRPHPANPAISQEVGLVLGDGSVTIVTNIHRRGDSASGPEHSITFTATELREIADMIDFRGAEK